MRGIDCKFYRNSAALGAGYASPTWNLVESVMDLEYTFNKEMFETTTRRENGIRTYEDTVSDVEVTFMLRVPELSAAAGDVDFDDFVAFESAFLAGTVIDCEVLNGARATSGSRGFRGFFRVAEFSESQKNGETVFRKVTLKPSAVDAVTKATTAAAVAFQYAKVISGTMTYSTPPALPA